MQGRTCKSACIRASTSLALTSKSRPPPALRPCCQDQRGSSKAPRGRPGSWRGVAAVRMPAASRSGAPCPSRRGPWAGRPAPLRACGALPPGPSTTSQSPRKLLQKSIRFGSQPCSKLELRSRRRSCARRGALGRTRGTCLSSGPSASVGSALACRSSRSFGPVVPFHRGSTIAASTPAKLPAALGRETTGPEDWLMPSGLGRNGLPAPMSMRRSCTIAGQQHQRRAAAWPPPKLPGPPAPAGWGPWPLPASPPALRPGRRAG
mmetsp:Transcript_103764/g.288937  ORF Transcript_103764/g.288937 Transcript_103764/m.288937 type:complete len:263 (-) Transcript_103764:1211-1999(-)